MGGQLHETLRKALVEGKRNGASIAVSHPQTVTNLATDEFSFRDSFLITNTRKNMSSYSATVSCMPECMRPSNFSFTACLRSGPKPSPRRIRPWKIPNGSTLLPLALAAQKNSRSKLQHTTLEEASSTIYVEILSLPVTIKRSRATLNITRS